MYHNRVRPHKLAHGETFDLIIYSYGHAGLAQIIHIPQKLVDRFNFVAELAGGHVLLFLGGQPALLNRQQGRQEFKAYGKAFELVVADEVIVMTNDGSYGKEGLVTNGIEEVIKREKVDLCVTIGPAIMMKFVALLTKKYNLPTVASLNTIMVDGTGMCGACRITVGGKTKFVCVDGPEFDAHQVDFDEMLMRLKAYDDVV